MTKSVAVQAPANESERDGAGPVEAARQAATSPEMAMITRVGYAAKGVVYVVIGILAVLAANNAGGAMTDNNGAIQTVAGAPFGGALLAVITAGLTGYALWYLLRGAADLDRLGAEPKALAVRAGYVLVGLSYLALVFGALQLLLGFGDGGKSSDNSTKDWTSTLLAQSWGVWLVVIAGLAVIGGAAVQAHLAYTAGFTKYLNLSSLSGHSREWVIRLGRFGIAARSVIYFVIGLFLIFAAFYHDPSQAKGIAGALTFLAQQNYGQVVGGGIALGLVAYGAFSFIQARYLRLDQFRNRPGQ